MRSIRATLGLAFTVALFAAGCYAGAGATVAPVAPNATSKPDPTVAPGGDSSFCGSTTLSIDYLPLTVEKLASAGMGFATAEVTGLGAPFFNTADGKSPPGTPSEWNKDLKIFTPIEVQVAQGIAGDAKPGSTQFLVLGGTVGCYTMYVTTSPSVEVGSEYVFVLDDAVDAGQTAAGLSKADFAWPVDAKGDVATVDGKMSLGDLRTTVLDAISTGTD
jgi:hypothetical protein